jgi:stage III sporulation protein AG
MSIDDVVKKIANTVRNFEENNSKSKDNITKNQNKFDDLKDNSHKSSTQSNKLFNIVVLVMIGILCVIGSNYFKSASKTTLAPIAYDNNQIEVAEDKEQYTLKEMEAYEERLSSKLKHILEQIDGVGKAEVMIYFESGEEHIPAINQTDFKSVTDETDTNGGKRKINQDNDGKTVVMLNEGEKTKPFITKTYEPKITGICIVAEGAEDKVTELRINQAVVNLFNLEEEKVNVYPMKN